MRRDPRSVPRWALLVVLLGLCAAVAVPHAQPADTARAALNRGLALRGPAAQTEAESWFRRAIDLARQEGAPITEGHACRALAGVLAARGDLAAAERLWDGAAAIFTTAGDWNGLGDVHSQRALAAWSRGARDEAEREWLASYAAFEAAGHTLERARALRNLTFLDRLDVRTRIALASQALDLVTATSDRRLEGAIRHQLSDLHVVDGDLAAAVAYLDTAVPLLEAGDDRRAYGRALTSLGRLKRMFGQPAESVALNRRAAHELEALDDLAGAAQAMDAVARARLDLDDLDGALAAAQDAVTLSRRSGRREAISAALSRQAIILARLGRGPEAEAALGEAAPPDGAPSDVRTRYYDARASAYHSLGRYADALATRDHPDNRPLTAEDRVWQRSNRALSLLGLNRRRDAEAEMRLAVTELDALTANLVPEDVSKRAYFERMRQLVDRHVSMLARLDDAEAALAASERGRARAFLDLMTGRAGALAGPKGATPVDLASVAPARVPAADAGPAVGHDEVRAPRVVSIDDLVTRGAPSATAAPPEPRIPSAGQATPPSLDDVKGVAARLQSHLVAYWVSDDETLIWVIAPDGTVTMTRSAVSRHALATLASAAVPESAAPARGPGRVSFEADSGRALRRLHDLLIAPIRAALPTAPGALVTIIPHGPLFRVSFAALADRRGRYLVEDYRLHYAPSIGTLTALPARPAGDGAVVVVADPDPGAPAGGTALPRLPAAAAEARAIARTLAPREVRVLAGRDATEARVRDAMGRASVLHFATHGVVSDTAPWTSYLALAGPGPGTSGGSGASTADGQLRAGELYDLQLDAGMVVLGACRTATGPLTGDGITGLARGFFAAGVPVVVASLWDLPDATTALMQPAFYRRWKTSGSAADALRNAQLDLLRRLRAGRVVVTTPAGPLALAEHPSLWAGLVVLGMP